MKNLFTLSLLFAALSAQSQFGVHAGVNNSWFAGQGKFTGINHSSQGIRAGLFDKIQFKHTFLQVELNYLKMGAKNPEEHNRHFSTYMINLPVTFGVKAGPVNFQIGAYLSRLIYARNYDFSGGNYGWHVNKWDWYRLWTKGFTGAIGYDLNPIYLEIHGLYGIDNVRHVKHDDSKMWGNKDMSLAVSLYVPFKTFK